MAGVAGRRKKTFAERIAELDQVIAAHEGRLEAAKAKRMTLLWEREQAAKAMLAEVGQAQEA